MINILHSLFKSHKVLCVRTHKNLSNRQKTICSGSQCNCFVNECALKRSVWFFFLHGTLTLQINLTISFHQYSFQFLFEYGKMITIHFRQIQKVDDCYDRIGRVATQYYLKLGNDFPLNLVTHTRSIGLEIMMINTRKVSRLKLLFPFFSLI